MKTIVYMLKKTEETINIYKFSSMLTYTDYYHLVIIIENQDKGKHVCRKTMA